MLCLYLKASFAAFRTFTAGSFRPTADFLTHSAAYGILLNVAGIEMRLDDEKKPMTLIRSGLPSVRLALGALAFPERQTMYQQLHNYPVGSDAGKEYEQGAKGNKYNIAPVTRAFLSGLEAYICIDDHDELEQHILDGLNGRRQRSYGLPFAGENNFIIDKLEHIKTTKPAYWYEMVAEDSASSESTRVSRFTITIDREDMSQTRTALFAPTTEPVADIPESAWVEVGY